MSLALQTALLSAKEYLEGELTSDIRHEYLAGQVFAMAGAGEKHNRIAGNLFFHLRSSSRGTPCGVYISDMKVRVEHNDAFYYPDVMLACDPSDSEPLYKRHPCLIAEVLSPATEAIDRREKLIAYRSLASLRYYLLVSQDERFIEIYTRGDQGNFWLHSVYKDTGTLEILCQEVRAVFSVEDVYEDVRL